MNRREILEQIHLRQAESMLSMLEEEGRELTAQELNAINKFLSDNGMDLATASPPVRHLTSSLKRKFSDPEADKAESA